MDSHSPEQSELGKSSGYDTEYNPDRLFAVLRQPSRTEMGIAGELPFSGFDLWNHYEVSWLNEKGKPVVALAEIRYDCRTPYIVESKSLKLYFNSLNQTRFPGAPAVAATVKKDLERCIQGIVAVEIILPRNNGSFCVQDGFSGECIDESDVECTAYTPDPALLSVTDNPIEETLFSNLLRSNCPVTGQPDWGSVLIHYRGNRINSEGLLRYIVSFRSHQEFHEHCIERMFMDIHRQCQPESLTVYGRYTRRGGLDINPVRSTESDLSDILSTRLIRQ